MPRAFSKTKLPLVSLVMLRASRIGTPAEMRVPSVRVKRAVVVFWMILPMTGVQSRMVSSTARPGSAFRTSLMKTKMKMGETQT